MSRSGASHAGGLHSLSYSINVRLTLNVRLPNNIHVRCPLLNKVVSRNNNKARLQWWTQRRSALNLGTNILTYWLDSGDV
jgi:hypothetical protein